MGAPGFSCVRQKLFIEGVASFYYEHVTVWLYGDGEQSITRRYPSAHAPNTRCLYERLELSPASAAPLNPLARQLRQQDAAAAVVGRGSPDIASDSTWKGEFQCEPENWKRILLCCGLSKQPRKG